MKFEIITDSSANLTDSLIEKYDLKIISLSYFIGE
ncbi:MAG: DegV family protein, partial [Proteocatella sp.]|nr:DegV family protein [Proteocatella sp.]